jgi:hypothetical protein
MEVNRAQVRAARRIFKRFPLYYYEISRVVFSCCMGIKYFLLLCDKKSSCVILHSGYKRGMV